MENRIAIFSKLVRDFMRALPLAVPVGTSLADIARRMGTEQAPSATVTDGQGRPTGIVTERDIARRAAFGLDGDTAAADVMTAPVFTIGAEEYLYYAIARMRRLGLRHMPVVDESGAASGHFEPSRRRKADQARAEGDGSVQEAGRAGGLTGTEIRVD